jgi:hypothetical protein
MVWQPDKNLENDITLNEYQLKELGIMKQAIIKSAIEGGVIKKKWKFIESNKYLSEKDIIENNIENGIFIETDEEFVERWIIYCRRNEKKDRDLFFKQTNPF